MNDLGHISVKPSFGRRVVYAFVVRSVSYVYVSRLVEVKLCDPDGKTILVKVM